MILLNKVVKEVIEIAHNTKEEMNETVDRLKESGWSSNTRFTMSGTGLHKEGIYPHKLEEFKNKYPDLKIHQNDGIAGLPYYFYLTRHEREVKIWTTSF